MPQPRKADPIKHCAACNKEMKRKRINGRLQDRATFLKQKYCNRSCMANGQTKDTATRSAIQKRIAKHRKSSCELCGSTKVLSIHHKDRNWKNNVISNLQTLCSSCHTSLHHEAGDIVQRKPKPPCMVCGKPSYRVELCNTHLTRKKRYGHPCLVKVKNGASWQLVLDPSGLSGQAWEELLKKFPVGWTDLEHSETP